MGGLKKLRVDDYKDPISLFMNGTLHLITDDSSVVTVDTGRKSWRKISRPHHDQGCIRQSRRRLHVAQIDNYTDNGCLLSAWFLEDASGDWTLKHTANLSELLGRHVQEDDEPYTLIASRPDCDWIFFIDEVEKKFMLYDMDSRMAQVVYNDVEYYYEPYHPYTPCFAEWLTTRW